MINKIFIQGNLTADPNLRYTATNNLPVCTFDIAYNSQEHTDYFRVECWRKLAENVNKYCHKGSKVLVEGKLATDEYEKDGVKKKFYKIVAFAVEFLDTKSSDEKPAQNIEEKPKDNFNNAEDDLPF